MTVTDTTSELKLSDVIGRNGKYQLATFIFSMLQNTIAGYLRSSFQYLAPDVTIYWSSNGSRQDQQVFKSSHCHLQDILNSKPNDSNVSFSLIYESDISSWTLTEQFQLICERSWLINLGKTLSLSGSFVAYFLFSFLSERLGRKLFFLHMAIPVIFAHLCILFATSYAMIAVGCFFQGFSILSNTASYISMVEVIPSSRRPAYAYIAAIFRTFGDPVAATISLIFKDWFHTQIAYTVYVTLCYALAWYILESPSWLVARGRDDEAKKVIKCIVQRNGSTSCHTDLHISQWMDQTKKKAIADTSKIEGNIHDLFKRSKIRKYLLSLIWIEVGITVSSLSLTNNLAFFGSNIYEDAYIGTAVSIAFCIACMFTISKVSLRQCIAFHMFIFSVLCCLYPLIEDYPLVRTIFSAFGRGIGNLLSCTCNAYILEVLPTSVRGIGSGFIRIFSRLASLTSPFTQQLAEITAQYVPVLIFGLIILPNAFIYIFVLPETKGKPLVQTIEELETTDQEYSSRKTPIWIIGTCANHKKYQMNQEHENRRSFDGIRI